MQGGENVADKNHREPAGYKDEGASANQTRNTQDKQMAQTGSMGSVEVSYPGDLERKQKISRAGRRNAILKEQVICRSKFKDQTSLKKRANGSVDRKNSVFQVFAETKVLQLEQKKFLLEI